MPRKPFVPANLARHVFTLADARASGLTLSALKGRSWMRLGPQIYCRRGLQPDPWDLLAAHKRLLPPSALFAGNTAAWMHGLDAEPGKPVHVIVPVGSSLRSHAGLNVWRSEVALRDTAVVRGFAVTSVPRTLLDVCLRFSPPEALVLVDMAVQRGKTDPVALTRHANEHSGRAGAARLRLIAGLAAPAESPMESRLRWVLLQAGVPRPEVQGEVRDAAGRFLARVDLLFRSARLVVEFDGGNHRERLVSDDRRQNLLMNAGYRVLRYTTADVTGRPEAIVAQVREGLASAVGTDFWRQTGATGRHEAHVWRHTGGIPGQPVDPRAA